MHCTQKWIVGPVIYFRSPAVWQPYPVSALFSFCLGWTRSSLSAFYDDDTDNHILRFLSLMGDSLDWLLTDIMYTVLSVCLSMCVSLKPFCSMSLFFISLTVWYESLICSLSLSLSNVIIFIWYVMWQSVYLCVLGVQYYTILILRDSHHSFHS